MTGRCCLIRKVKMTKILVVGLVMILAAAGSARADGTNGKSDQSSSPPATTGSAHSSGSARSSGSGAVQKGVQPNLPANWRVQRPLDRSELLARQAAYFNRSRVNPATAHGTDPNTANTGQVRAGGQVSTDVPSEGLIPKRHHRDGENNSQNATSGTQATGSHNGAIPATNTRPRSGKPVLNFNNANTVNFTDACRRHRDRHDRDWWRNHCHTIILIGGGFYAWDLGYWYPGFGYDS